MEDLALTRATDRHTADQGKRSAAYDAAVERINAAFDLLGKVSPDLIAVPVVRWNGSSLRPGSDVMSSVIGDATGYDEIHALLCQVVAQSACPLVAKLRDAIRQRHITNHADDLADWSAE